MGASECHSLYEQGGVWYPGVVPDLFLIRTEEAPH
jgi:hypothetical protein